MVERILAIGGTAIAVGADVSVEEQVVKLFQTVDEQLGSVNALVNNAGGLARQARVDEMGDARIQRILSVNVLGSMLRARGGASHVDPTWWRRWIDREPIVGSGSSRGRR